MRIKEIINRMKVNSFKQLNIIKIKIISRFLEYIKIKIIVLYSKITLEFKTSYKYGYIIPFIFKKLGNDMTTDAEPLVSFSFNILILSLIILTCFINITGYFLSIYLITKYKVEDKYPKFLKMIKYFDKSSIFFVIIEIILCLFCLCVFFFLV
uniref:Uncharacterized protein n=1 Tax=Phallus indusiatus TaxID=146777 RepID=A0A7D5J7T6_9AGAM|nr:hypothetical protein [Dictyophora indusiata]QLD96637.1 hypothetical protein [Dictyophora indusiata]